MDQRLKVLGFVDYQALVARVLCGETMAQDTKGGEQPPLEPGNESTTEHHGEEFDAEGIGDPPPAPSTSPTSSLSHSRPFPVPNDPKSEGTTQDATQQNTNSHSELNPEGIVDVPPPSPPQQQQQRSVSLDALMVTLPTMSEGEIRSGRSTSELRRRHRLRLRASVFEIFRPDDSGRLDFREKV